METVISEMSDRELLEELVTNFRAIMAAFEVMSNNPMLKAMMPQGVLR